MTPMWPTRGDSWRFEALEWAHFMTIARDRYERNRERGIADRLVTSTSPIHNDAESIAAEVAFSRLAGVDPLLDTDRPHPAYDVVIGGKRVDIKWTQYSTGALILAEFSNSRADVFALMVGTWPRYTYRGSIGRAALLSRGVTSTAANGRRLARGGYVAPQGVLR